MRKITKSELSRFFFHFLRFVKFHFSMAFYKKFHFFSFNFPKFKIFSGHLCCKKRKRLRFTQEGINPFEKAILHCFYGDECKTENLWILCALPSAISEKKNLISRSDYACTAKSVSKETFRLSRYSIFHARFKMFKFRAFFKAQSSCL